MNVQLKNIFLFFISYKIIFVIYRFIKKNKHIHFDNFKLLLEQLVKYLIFVFQILIQ